MRGFVFTNAAICEGEDVFYARLSPNITSKKELFDALYYSCWFPWYFGFNWDALDEVITNFSWIKEKNIIIRHESISKIPKEVLVMYIRSITDSFEMFSEDDKNMCYVFNEEDENLIDGILSSIGRDRLGREIK